jgi:hypothetical protein
MLADAGAEMHVTELLEALRRRLVGGKMRLQKAGNAFVGDLGRQAKGVGLKRIPRVNAVREDGATPLQLSVLLGR